MAKYILIQNHQLAFNGSEHEEFWEVTGIDGQFFPQGSKKFFVLKQAVTLSAKRPAINRFATQNTNRFALSNLRAVTASWKGQPEQPDSFYEIGRDYGPDHLWDTIHAWNTNLLVLTRGVPSFNYTWDDLCGGVLKMRGTMQSPDFTGEHDEDSSTETCWLPCTARLRADDDAVSRLIAMGTGQNVPGYLGLAPNLFLPCGIVAHIDVSKTRGNSVAWFSSAEIQVKGPLTSNLWSVHEGIFVGGVVAAPTYYWVDIPEELGVATWPKRPYTLDPHLPGNPAPGSGQGIPSESAMWFIRAQVYTRQLQDDHATFTPFM